MANSQVENVLATLGLPIGQLRPLAKEIAPKAKAIQGSDNLTKFGNLIALAEGTGQHGAKAYNIAFGGGFINDLSAHPNQLVGFTETTGKKNKSSAAGKYQFLKKTWDGLSKKTGVKDFSPESQEINFRELLREKKVLGLVEAGDFNTAIQKLGKTFASLPSSTYSQNKRSWDWIGKTAQGLGIPNVGVAGMSPTPELSERAIVEAALPSQEQNIAIAQRAQEDQNRAMFENELAAVKVEANARRSELDKMIESAFNFDKVFSMTTKTELPTEYDDKLLKLVEAV